METVGMKALRENLAAYVTRAREGERIVITDRGEEVAVLAPLSGEVQALRRLVAEGRIQWSGQPPRIPRQGIIVNRDRPLSDEILAERHDSLL